jgi:YD repeat-containing protein
MRRVVSTLMMWLAVAVMVKADLSTPLTSLGNANAHGELQLWINLDEADYGDGLLLPVRITFISGQQSDSPYLGRSFWLPLAEAKAYPITEKTMRVQLICGKTIYLRKDLKNPNSYYTMDQKTTGTVDGDRFILKQSDGWEIRYKNGKIWQVQTDKGRVLTWYYRNNIANEIKDERNSRSSFQVEYGTNGKPSGFSVNGKTHTFDLGKKPRVEYIENKKVVGGMDEALSVWAYPDGKKDTYEFAVTQELQPTLKRTDTDGKTDSYQWDAKTGFIISDSGWKYKIENNVQFPKLRRYNDKGQEEFRIVDNRTGVVNQKTIEEGDKITEVFRTPGPLYGKVRKVENILPNGTRKTIYQAAYDDKGKLIRKVNEKGFTTVYKYAKDGKLADTKMLRPTDPSILKQLKAKEKELLAAVSSVTDKNLRESAVEELGYFYVKEWGEAAKALPLISQLTDARKVYGLKLVTAFSGVDLTGTQRINLYKQLLKDYPEKKEFLEKLIKRTEEKERRT